ncbi:NACHT domain-containing protein [Streptomyces sp. NPDC056468]|uniref:NACHT domain-containing protein n=1 Tax=Streptomyces sp. NPDC056468 TaxID=3345830 RepID=UPI00368702E4
MSLPDITAFYEATRPARLVITGAAGAGKTVLALELMLALIKKRGEHDPVPVRVPLAEWDPSFPLRVLLVDRLADDYGWHRNLASVIVDAGLVLPVLDGLDEMDPTRPDGTPDPEAPRARAALDQLNRYQATDGLHPAPLIMTCRSTHYDALPQTGILIDAARITITPVDPNSAAAYLAARARDPLRWQSLLHHLRAHPTSPHALALSTPWRLCLTATSYQDAGNPDELLGYSTQHGLDHHLLSRYIPAVTRISAKEHRYTPRRVHRWLHVLASHLATNTSDGTDLALPRQWPLAGSARVRRTDSLFTTLACLLPLPLAWLTPAPLPVAGAVAAIAVLTGRSALKSTSVELGAIGFKGVRTLRGFIGFTSRLTIGALVGLAAGLVASIGGRLGLLGLAGAAGAVVAIVPAIVMSDELEDGSPDAALPRTALQEDIVFSLLGGLTVALGTGIGVIQQAGDPSSPKGTSTTTPSARPDCSRDRNPQTAAPKYTRRLRAAARAEQLGGRGDDRAGPNAQQPTTWPCGSWATSGSDMAAAGHCRSATARTSGSLSGRLRQLDQDRERCPDGQIQRGGCTTRSEAPPLRLHQPDEVSEPPSRNIGLHEPRQRQPAWNSQRTCRESGGTEAFLRPRPPRAGVQRRHPGGDEKEEETHGQQERAVADQLCHAGTVWIL